MIILSRGEVVMGFGVWIYLVISWDNVWLMASDFVQFATYYE